MTRFLRAGLVLAYAMLAVGFAILVGNDGLEWNARLIAAAVSASCLHTAWRARPSPQKPPKGPPRRYDGRNGNGYQPDKDQGRPVLPPPRRP